MRARGACLPASLSSVSLQQAAEQAGSSIRTVDKGNWSSVKPGELWFRLGTIQRIDGEALKDDKDGKNSNLDLNLKLLALDPPLEYPLNASRLKDKFRVRGQEDDPEIRLEDEKRKEEARRKREIKKKKDKGEKVDQLENATVANMTLADLTNKSVEVWDLDPGGIEVVPGNATVVMVHRSALAYVDLEMTQNKGNGKGRVTTFSLKSTKKGDTEDVLELATGKWWRTLADEWKNSIACTATPDESKKDDRYGGRKSHTAPKHAGATAEKPDAGATAPAVHEPQPLNITVGVAEGNTTFSVNVTQEDVAAAIASEYLDRRRTREEVLETVDARLDAMQRKLRWLADMKNASLLSDADHDAQKQEVLAAFRRLEG